jgi:outer membrane protein TolC
VLQVVLLDVLSHLNLEQAKQMALKNSQIIKAYEEKLKAAKYKKYQADGAYAPKINITQNYVSTDEPANAAFMKMAQGRFDMNYFAMEMANPDRVDNFGTTITLMQPIFINGKIYFGRKQAIEMSKATEFEVKRTTQYVLLNLHKAFYGLSLSQKALEVSKESLKRTKKYYDMTKEFLKNGMVVKSDLLVAESHYLLNEEAVKEAEKNYYVAMSQLQRLINTDDDINIIWEEPDNITLEDLNSYMQTALTSRQDLLAMQSMLNITKYEMDKTKSKFLPSVALFADYKMNDTSFLGDAGTGTTYGVMLNWNIFNGFSDRNSYMEKKSEHLSLMHKIADYKLKIKSEVKDAYYSYLAASKKLEAIEKRAEASKEALKITESRYKEGLAKITDLLDREVELKQTELAVYMSKYNKLINKINLEFATGMLMYEEEK